MGTQMKEFEGKEGVVTGTTGIGRGIALRLATGGAQVMSCGSDAAANRELQQIADDRKLPLRVELCDVSKPEQVQAAVAKTVAQFGGLDYIANSAAIHPFGNSFETDPETWHKVMAGNLGSPGTCRTPMLATPAGLFSAGEPVDQVVARFGAAHPLGRVGTVEEVA